MSKAMPENCQDRRRADKFPPLQTYRRPSADILRIVRDTYARFRSMRRTNLAVQKDYEQSMIRAQFSSCSYREALVRTRLK